MLQKDAEDGTTGSRSRARREAGNMDGVRGHEDSCVREEDKEEMEEDDMMWRPFKEEAK